MGRVHLRGGGGSVADSRLKPLLQGRRPHEGPDATRQRNWRTLQSDACCDGVFGYSGTRPSHPVTNGRLMFNLPFAVAPTFHRTLRLRPSVLVPSPPPSHLLASAPAPVLPAPAPPLCPSAFLRSSSHFLFSFFFP